jgi:hypothetical protein
MISLHIRSIDGHLPQLKEKGAMTRSPFLNCLTLVPISTISPMTSCPRVYPVAGPSVPR